MRIKQIFLSGLLALIFMAPGFSDSNKIISQVQSNTALTSGDYIYVREPLPNGNVLVYVYLSDGITLVNIYEVED